MGAFVLTYSVVWSMLIIYVVCLGVAERRLRHTAQALGRLWEQGDEDATQDCRGDRDPLDSPIRSSQC